MIGALRVKSNSSRVLGNLSLTMNSTVYISKDEVTQDTKVKVMVHVDQWATKTSAFLTLKAPSIICSRRQFQILSLFQK